MTKRTSEATATIAIRQATHAEARRLARLHQVGLPDAFLSSLGRRFLTRLYRRLIADPNARVLLAEADGKVIGFVAGALDAERVVSGNRLAAGLAALPRLVRPSVLRRALETARYRPAANLPRAELLSIAVDPASRRGGVGAKLTRALLSELQTAGAREVKVVAAASNDAANLFYAAMGLTHAATIEVHRGERSNVWVSWQPSL